MRTMVEDNDAARPQGRDPRVPRRRGGGPPGGSAWDESGQIRRITVTRAIPEPPPPPTVTFEPLPDVPAETIAEPVEELTFESVFEPTFDVDEVFTSAPDVEADTSPPRAPSGPRSFPGGRVRLPRLEGGSDEPELTFVGTAFVRTPRNTTSTDDGDSRGGFEEYFTYESLFEESDEPEVDRAEDPYEILGVTREDSWKTINAAHRRLAKECHPDRLVDASPEEVEAATEALRRINEAYDRIKELRPPDH